MPSIGSNSAGSRGGTSFTFTEPQSPPIHIYWTNLPTNPLSQILRSVRDHPALAEALSIARLWVHDNHIHDLDNMLLAAKLVQQVEYLNKNY